MAFTYATLVPIGGTNSRGIAAQVWSYTTGDAITDMDSSNYWAGAYARGMRAGDIVLASCADGPATVQVSALAAATSTAILG